MTWLAQFQQGSLFAGDYQIIRPLKEGGMGAVYVAKQLSTDKLRALKLMQPQLVREPRLRKRFQDEARVAARIKSRHVVEVIGAGVDEKTGLPWLAMELLEGQDLDSRVREGGPLSGTEINEVFAQLCHAMGAAHEAGIVHRDLKPENIFLADERQVGVPFTVKVLDFGIAKIRDDAQADRTNAPVGTATYMAPEQSTVEQDVTPAADVWAIGLIAFFTLTGKQYWKSANQQPCNLHSIVGETAYAPLVPASQRAQELGHAQPLLAGFDGWFERCVVRELERRFANATAAYEALGALLSGLPARSQASVARVPSVVQITTDDLLIEPTAKLWRLNKTAFIPDRSWLVPLGGLGLVFGLVVGITQLVGRAQPQAAMETGDMAPLQVKQDLGAPVLVDRLKGGIAPAEKKQLTWLSGGGEAQQEDKPPGPEPSIAVKPTIKVHSRPNECQRQPTNMLLGACERGGNAQACHAVGERYAAGKCVKKKPGFAQVMWTRACKLGDETACSHLERAAE